MEYQINKINNSFDLKFSNSSDTRIKITSETDSVESDENNIYVQLILQELLKDPDLEQLSFSF